MAVKKKTEKLPVMRTRLGVLIASYNQFLVDVVMGETDLRLIEYLVLSEPKVDEHLAKKRNIEEELKKKTKLLSIITERIVEAGSEKN